MNLKTIILSSVLFLAIDAIYLTSFSNFFNKLVKNIQGSKIKFNVLGAVICYIFLILGLNYFILSRNKSPFEASLFGLVIYGVYESTNYAIFDKWSLEALMLDTIWGGILFYLTTFLTYKLNKKL
tara:strand:- start:285 stop:659 length:375 start_codon:yes stop_codon:yes gene_type:complete